MRGSGWARCSGTACRISIQLNSRMNLQGRRRSRLLRRSKHNIRFLRWNIGDGRYSINPVDDT
jgi:hypothetical protein